MRRKLFALAVGVSAVVFLATVVLWVRSYWASDGVAWERANYETIAVGIVRAGLMLVSVGRKSYVPDGWHPSPAPSPALRIERGGPPDDPSAWAFASPPEHEWRFAGLWYRSIQRGYLQFRTLFVPGWLLLLVTAPLPGVWLAAWRRRRVAASRQSRGRCPACGYDLRATPDRCPECGTAAGATREPVAPRPPAR